MIVKILRRIFDFMKLSKEARGIVKRTLTRISPKLETIFNYRYSCGEWIDWKNPQDINAIINILKVTDYYNNPEITMCVDKYRIRDWIKTRGGQQILPILYGAYDRPEDIEWKKFPDSFVVKCNHACGTNLIVPDKSALDITKAVETLTDWMKIDYWKEGEVQYRYVNKKIIVEEYLGNGNDLKTYKFFCFNGEPKVLYISMDEDKYIDYYDMEFNKLPYSLPPHEHYPYDIEKPNNFDELVSWARKLSAHFPFVRVDLYSSFNHIYISELTFIPTGGYMKIDPPETLKEWGSWMNWGDRR